MSPIANPIRTPDLPFVPIREGVSFRPIRFDADGWTLQLKVEPGTTVARHRHTGEVHALTLSGRREIIDTGEIVGPGDYVYEPPGNVDSWRCFGDEPCIVHITLTGRVEYLGENGEVLFHTDTHNQRAAYLAWCAENGVAPNAPMVG
ncbi:2,4'-dihydroxyacetophenone dioxygenase family protein [Amphiplicatus metriothermophilus]|uniref:Cupin domain-containing protein n=1 Tax=Amphiplicatus metriothermophilus TaxID=1519374 RepID=A0A239PJT2_9PROT|nr:2,4'-dihydroxyacetophenone dioxygenase family protein [Amphiplicatus metriothermophilus]MBB5517598.1 anti-sigma factor ChrR (cupin superfamily) [Amphiplicatus metriothermophilus]SNT68068.1 Cupin domain-containing protein [Amphiplicatus metriothermophilus]